MASVQEHGDLCEAILAIRKGELDRLVELQQGGFDPLPHLIELTSWATEGGHSHIMGWLHGLCLSTRCC